MKMYGVTELVLTSGVLGFQLEDGRFISVPLGFYPTLALATSDERARFEINGSSVYWPALDADIGVEGLLAGARASCLCAARGGTCGEAGAIAAHAVGTNQDFPAGLNGKGAWDETRR